MPDTLRWSRFAWAYFHMVSTAYPLTPTGIDEYNYFELYKFFGLTLPCSICSKHYTEIFNQLPIEPALASRDLLFQWTVRFHNAVNKSLGKREMSLQTAIHRYITNRIVYVDPPSMGWIIAFVVMAFITIYMCIRDWLDHRD